MITRPIVEAFLQNEYKLFINRILCELKADTKTHYTDTFQYRFNEKNYRAMIRGEFAGNIKNVRVVEVTNTIYFVADLDFSVQNIYYDYWNAHDTYRDLNELVIDFIKYYKRTDSFISGSDKSTKEDLVKDGLKKIDINSDKDIKNSEIYKTLISHAKEVSNIGISCTLKPDVCKRLKERDNVIPLMWIDAKSNMLNYPFTRLRSSNLMSSASRSTMVIDNLKSNSSELTNIVYHALRFTPYGRWLDIKMDKVTDEITHII